MHRAPRFQLVLGVILTLLCALWTPGCAAHDPGPSSSALTAASDHLDGKMIPHNDVLLYPQNWPAIVQARENDTH